MIYFLQIDIPKPVQNSLIEYGILGIAVLALGYFAWYQHTTLQKYATETQRKSDAMTEKFIELSKEQTAIASRQTNIQEQQLIQQKEYNSSVTDSLKNLPAQVVREMNYEKMKEQQRHHDRSQEG